MARYLVTGCAGFLADISAAREAFGYEPFVSFEEGLRRTVAWYQQQIKEADPQTSLV